MANAGLGDVLRHIRRMADIQALEGEADAALVERFATAREEAVFAVLLQRHGPMVLGVCRRVLGREAMLLVRDPEEQMSRLIGPVAIVLLAASCIGANDQTGDKPTGPSSRAERLKTIEADYQAALDAVIGAIRAGKVKAGKDGTYPELAQLRGRFAKLTRELIDADPKDDVALDAILFSMGKLVADQGDLKLYEVISAHHLHSAKLGEILGRMYATEEFLHAVAANSPHADVRGGATLALAKRLARAGRPSEAEALCEPILKDKDLAKLHGAAHWG
jgi:hypothetical protein